MAAGREGDVLGVLLGASDNGLTVPAVNLEEVLVAGSGVAYESTLAGPAVVNVTGTGSTEDEDCRSASLENVAGYGLYTTLLEPVVLDGYMVDRIRGTTFK